VEIVSGEMTETHFSVLLGWGIPSIVPRLKMSWRGIRDRRLGKVQKWELAQTSALLLVEYEK